MSKHKFAKRKIKVPTSSMFCSHPLAPFLLPCQGLCAGLGPVGSRVRATTQGLAPAALAQLGWGQRGGWPCCQALTASS